MCVCSVYLEFRLGVFFFLFPEPRSQNYTSSVYIIIYYRLYLSFAFCRPPPQDGPTRVSSDLRWIAGKIIPPELHELGRVDVFFFSSVQKPIFLHFFFFFRFIYFVRSARRHGFVPNILYALGQTCKMR